MPEDMVADQETMILPEKDHMRAMALMKILESRNEDTELVDKCSCGGFLEYSNFPSSFTRGKQYFEATSAR